MRNFHPKGKYLLSHVKIYFGENKLKGMMLGSCNPLIRNSKNYGFVLKI